MSVMASPSFFHLTTGQHGLVTTSQLDALGWSAEERRWAVRGGDLLPHRRGVLEVPGLPADPWRPLQGALLAAPDAVAGGFAAAGLGSLPDVDPGAVEVVTPRTTMPRLRGVRSSVDASLADAAITHIEGMPCLAPGEALVSLIGRVNERTWRRMVDDIERRDRANGIASIQAAIERRGPKHRPSLGALEALLDVRVPGAAGDCPRTSEVLRWLAEAGMPTPQQQVPVRWMGIPNVCDLVWMERSLNLEVDDDWSHSTIAGARRDKARDTRARRCGWQVERVTPESTREDVVGAVRHHLALRAVS